VSFLLVKKVFNEMAIKVFNENAKLLNDSLPIMREYLRILSKLSS